MWKKIRKIKFVLVVTLAIAFTAISTTIYPDMAVAAGFRSFVDTEDGYQFSYPNGWLQVKVANGPDVVFHDLIEVSENVSVVISPVPQGKSLTELGTPTEVGYKLGKSALAPEGSGRSAELVNVAQKEINGNNYYFLEYAVKLGNGQSRHNVASVAVSRGKLFTFNASVPERRWRKLQRTIDEVVSSFQVY
ncbi:photosystem II reaction center PsbP [Cylindrospermopsis raciborskii]|uniref:Photosystem II oxygen evolving complex protein PsbP n=1 Tax=Cylindrospermopsis raciborskii CENA302 TaxID=1170768 RepID=A0A9Q5QYA8_9CYAN|nr:photosystem II reaction center PsbP [Cylindrospermopsis raciborskii]OPH10412.1 photosystem II oxygen evolving complex protein PsbP [Cylindrospermopsis raciborskii CENA302]